MPRVRRREFEPAIWRGRRRIVPRRKCAAASAVPRRARVSGRKPALLTFTEEKYAGLAYYAKCTVHGSLRRAWSTIVSSGRALYSLLFTQPADQHRESPLYTLSRIILRTVGTSLLRFILPGNRRSVRDGDRARICADDSQGASSP